MGKDGFRGCGFPSRGQDHGSVFGTVVCKIQARKYYIKSLPLVPQDKSCFCLGERSTVQLAFDRVCLPEVGRLVGIYTANVLLHIGLPFHKEVLLITLFMHEYSKKVNMCKLLL